MKDSGLRIQALRLPWVDCCRVFSVLGVVAGSGLVGACAQQPAAVVNGYDSQGRRVVMSSVQTRKEAAQPLHRDEAMIEPAAGPVKQEPVMPVAVAPTPLRTVQAPPEPQPTMVMHTVAASDTGYKLARKYNTSIDRILKDNGLKSMTDIRQGQQLTIAQNSRPQVSAWDDMKRMLSEPVVPVPPQANVAEAPTVKMVEVAVPAVKPVAVEKVAVKAEEKPQVQAEAETPPKLLADIEPAAGERPKTDDGVTYATYTVQPKDTIYRISLKYNASVLDIMAANDFEEPQDLKADAKIRVPVKQTITQQLIAKSDVAQIAPAAGNEVPVVVASADKPVQVAMLSPAPAGAREAQQDDLETKAVKQQAMKDAALPEARDKPQDIIDEKMAEQKRGQVDPVAAKAQGLVWPVRGEVVRKFGDDGSGVARTGINIAVPKGTPVLASETGKVLYADDGLKIYGKMVLVRHDNGMVSAYAHNSYLLVRKNERVKKGQVIALSGATGNVESPQLHFELRQHASAVDPLAMLPRP